MLDVEEFLGRSRGSRPAARRSTRRSSAARDAGHGRSARPLSEREREVLELMAEGLTNTGIAQRLFLSERTVEAHVRHVLLKLDIPESEDGHRRVLAVLTHLREVHDWS